MKTSVVITLILMGTIIIVTPVFSDLLYQRNLVTLLSRPGVTNVDLKGQMGVFYRTGCWVAGCLMIGIAVLCALFPGKGSRNLE